MLGFRYNMFDSFDNIWKPRHCRKLGMADAFPAWKKKTYFYHDLGAQSRVFGYMAM